MHTPNDNTLDRRNFSGVEMDGARMRIIICVSTTVQHKSKYASIVPDIRVVFQWVLQSDSIVHKVKKKHTKKYINNLMMSKRGSLTPIKEKR